VAILLNLVKSLAVCQ